MIRNIKDCRGLTLIEIIVSIAILGVIIVPLSSLFTQSMKTNMAARERMTANQIAQKYMEELKHSTVVQMGSTTSIDSDTQLIIESTVEPFKESAYSVDAGQPDTKVYDAVISIEQLNSSKLNINGGLEVSFTDQDPLKLQFENEKMTYTINSVSNNVSHNLDDAINIKLMCYGQTGLDIIASNKSSKVVNIYVVRARANGREVGQNNVAVTTEEGKVYSYYNIYDESVLSPDLAAGESQRLYKITVKVSNKDQELIQISGLRSTK